MSKGIVKIFVFFKSFLVRLIFLGFVFIFLEGWLWEIIILVVFWWIIFLKIFWGWVNVFVVVLIVIIWVLSKWLFIFNNKIVNFFWVCYIKFWFKVLVVVWGLLIIVNFGGWDWNIFLFNLIVVRIVVVFVILILWIWVNFWIVILWRIESGLCLYWFNWFNMYCLRLIVESFFFFWFVFSKIVINLVVERFWGLEEINFFCGCLLLGKFVILRL